MFGWEFPPHITGGLGTACWGMTKGLLKQGVEVIVEDGKESKVRRSSDSASCQVRGLSHPRLQPLTN